MAFETIISVAALQALQESGAEVLLLDCGFELSDPDKGRRDFLEGHLPRAQYVDLERDLSGVPSGTNGRHPLPDREAFAARMRTLGLNKATQVVSYDAAGNFYAARLWWMLRWIGHAPVAVLDGGKAAWLAAGLPLESGDAPPKGEGDFGIGASLVADPVSADDVLKAIGTPDFQVLDARASDRFAGTPNPLDPVSGHIPGARNRFFRDNLDGAGRFRPADELAREFGALTAERTPVLQCGSGVSACHNALAMEIAGIKGARLYPGSWSEWISDPARPVATGEG